jgi:N-acetylneuraminic acid mutarotase
MRRTVTVVAALLAALTFPARLDAAGGQWLPRAPLATARQEVGAAVLDGRVYVVGGLAGPPLAALATVEMYDPALDDWSAAASLPAPRDHMGVAALAGELWVVGGFAGDFTARNETFVYDPSEDAWRAGPPLPASRGGLWMVEYGGKLYVFGGVDAADQAQRTVFVYDPSAGSWSAGADMPTAREHLNAVVVGSSIHVIGGRSAAGSSGAHERYDPATNTWTTLAPLPTARSAAAAAALGGRIWVAGGEVPRLFAVNEVYDVTSDRWCSDTPMAIPRHGIAAVALGDRIFAPAGGVVQGLQATSEADVFVPGDEPVLPTTPTCPAAPTACREPTAARRAALALSTRPPDTRKNRLAWLWGRGSATALADFGNPLAGDGLTLCVYDGGGLRTTIRVPGETPGCGAGAQPRWRATRRGFTYADRSVAADGVQRISLQSGIAGKARMALVARGAGLDLPAPATLASPVTVQLRSVTGACWSARYGFPPALRQTATRFTDRSD